MPKRVSLKGKGAELFFGDFAPLRSRSTTTASISTAQTGSSWRASASLDAAEPNTLGLAPRLDAQNSAAPCQPVVSRRAAVVNSDACEPDACAQSPSMASAIRTS